MRVCLDMQSAVAQRAGVGRYTRELALALAAQAGDDDLQLFYLDFRGRGRPFEVPGASWRRVGWCPGRVMQRAWHSAGWPPFDLLSGPADVFHFPNFLLPPLRKGRSVVTLHDLSFLRHPETTEERNLAHLSARIDNTAARADMVLTDSHFSAGEIRELLRVPEERIRAIPLGLGSGLAPPPEERVREFLSRAGLERPYLLHVGTLEPRKNLCFLVEVFERLPSGLDLVLAGRKGWKYEPLLERIAASPRAEQIRRLDYVEEADLPALYAGAALFVFPTLYEGFGFPPLEAMACGTPVVAARTGPLPEVLGAAAELVEGYEVEQWAAAIGTLLVDTQRREERRVRGRERAALFTWEKTARATWEAYRALA